MRAVEMVVRGSAAYREVADPEPGPGQLLVAVRVAGLNRRDLYVVDGQFGNEPPYRLLSDAVGRVVAVGAGVQDTWVGTDVVLQPASSCGRCLACLSGDEPSCPSFRIFDGAGADFVAVPERQVVPKPEGLSDEEAGVLGLVTETAYGMVFQLAKVVPGERVLVWGAEGGLGSVAVALAKLAGAFVVAVGRDREYLTARGADEVVDRRREDFAEELGRLGPFDVVLDSVGQETFPRSLSLVRRGGRLVVVGATTGGEVRVNLPEVFRRRIAVLGAYMGPHAALLRLLPLFASGRLKPPAVRLFPASEVGKAFAALRAGGVQGKLALKLGA